MPQAGSSTRVSHSLSWKACTAAQRLACRRPLAFQRSAVACTLRPVLAQRLDDRRHHQPLDVGARRVVGAEPLALVRVERLLEQRAEDRRLDLAPVLPSRLRSSSPISSRPAAAPWVGEEVAVELQHLGLERQAKLALVHRLQSWSTHRRERSRVVAAVVEQVA